MAEICKDIDAALANLNNKIDSLNAKLRELDRKQQECCDKKGNEQKPKDNSVDLTEIIRRLGKLEKTQEALKISTVETLNNFADIENANQDLVKAFQGVYEMVTPLIDVVGTVVGFLGEPE